MRVRVREHDDGLAALACLVAVVNAADRLAVVVHQRGGFYEAGASAAAVG